MKTYGCALVACSVGMTSVGRTEPMPVRLAQRFGDCLALVEASEQLQRRTCLSEVAGLVRHGLMYERCLLDVDGEHEASECPRPTLTKLSATEPSRARKNLLQKGEELASYLEAVAQGKEESPTETRKVFGLFRQAVGIVAAETEGAFTLVSQGGVSLGSWQAGYAYMTTELLKARERRRSSSGGALYRTVVGTSAGAVNSLASGLQGCSREYQAPQATLGFRVWVDLLQLFPSHFHSGLLQDDARGSLSLFSDAPLKAAMDAAKQAISSASSEKCSFDLGFVVTHIKGATSPVHLRQDSTDGSQVSLSAARSSERFAVHVELGNGAVSFRNVYDAVANRDQLVESVPDETFYPKLGTGAQPSEGDVLAGIQASGAFPMAFPPVTLGYQTYSPQTHSYETHHSTFVDGGVLENSPVGLGISLNQRRPHAIANYWFADLVSDPNTYIFASPSMRKWEMDRSRDGRNSDAAQSKELGGEGSFLGTYVSWVADVAATGTDARLAQAAEQYPFMRQEISGVTAVPRLLVPVRRISITGDQFGNFFAFAERDFRMFDYVVGMAEARRNFVDIEPGEIGVGDVDERLGAASETDPDGIGQKYQCLRDFYEDYVVRGAEAPCRKQFGGDAKRVSFCEEHPGLPASCASVGEPFRQLLRVNWRYTRWAREPTSFRAAEQFEHYLSLLRDEGYVFHDSVEPYRSVLASANGSLFTRKLSQLAVYRLTEKEGWVERKLMRAAGQIAADAAIYRLFPTFHWSLGYPDRGVEAGAGLMLYNWRQWYGLRLDTRARLYGLQTYDVTSETEPDYQAYMMDSELSLGLTNIIPPGTVGWADFEFGLGPILDYRFAPWKDGKRVVYGRFGVYGSAAFVVSQRLYFQLERRWFPVSRIQTEYVGTNRSRLSDSSTVFSLGIRFF
jgi:predicted acylesterase/phospholipase RssA